MKLKHIWTSRTLLFTLILLCGCIVSLVIHIALADSLGKRITDLEDQLATADELIDNARTKLGSAHDLMDDLSRDWNNLSDANRDKAVDAIISLLSFDWASLVKQGAKIGITFDDQSSLTSNFDSAVSRVEMLILELNTAIIRYYTTLGKVQNLIREHNAGHADRGYTPWEAHTVPSGPVEPPFVDDDLPDIPCKGGCGATMSSPSGSISDHRTTCGDGENVDAEARRRYGERTASGTLLTGSHDHIVLMLLSERSSTEGCGRDYYWCTQSEEHILRRCNKQVSDGDTSRKCGQSYRNCMPLSAQHNGNSYKTRHDESTEQQTTAPDPQTTTQVDNSPDCDSCTTGGCSSCPITGTCGHTYSPSEANSHALQASCSLSNNWMQTCTVTNFYACQTHTCVFPTVPCGNASCTQSVAFREEHRRWCINSNKYWTCSTTQPMDPNEYHRTRTCTRYKALRQERDPLTGLNTVVWGTCGEQWDMCDTRCWNATGGFGTHQE